MKFLLTVLAIVSCFCFSNCGQAKAGSNVSAILVPSPDGSTCYAIMQNGNAVGGNCK